MPAREPHRKSFFVKFVGKVIWKHTVKIAILRYIRRSWRVTVKWHDPRSHWGQLADAENFHDKHPFRRHKMAITDFGHFTESAKFMHFECSCVLKNYRKRHKWHWRCCDISISTMNTLSIANNDNNAQKRCLNAESKCILRFFCVSGLALKFSYSVDATISVSW